MEMFNVDMVSAFGREASSTDLYRACVVIRDESECYPER